MAVLNTQTSTKDCSQIRVIHNMARAGGTLISKCLATMDDVVLLSEIHPSGVNMFNPIHQAHEWYGLLNETDIQRLQQGSVNFVEAIFLIADRCAERGKILILRDWSHLDFIGLPFIQKPSYSLTLVDTLKLSRSVINTATVRHPVYQWFSVSNLPISKGLSLHAFLSGYRHFAEHCVHTGFVKYEDFAESPELELRTLCDRLQISYDDGWRDRWWRYKNITGDMGVNGKGEVKKSIKKVPYKKIDPVTLKAFLCNDDYQRSIELLGYEHL